MEPKTLRELIIAMEVEMSTAHRRPATIGQLMDVARMALKEIEALKVGRPSQE